MTFPEPTLIGKPTLVPESDKRPAVDPPGTEANLFNED